VQHHPEHTNDLSPVPGIEPRDGWALFTFDYEDGDGFTSPAYVARHADGRRQLLNVSRFVFTPTQKRWDWLVGHGFPAGAIVPSTGARGPLDDIIIDNAIAADRVRAA